MSWSIFNNGIMLIISDPSCVSSPFTSGIVTLFAVSALPSKAVATLSQITLAMPAVIS